MENILIGIAGGSCSGKTTFGNKILNKLGPEKTTLIFQDNYYIDQSAQFDHDGGSVNFDHPKAIDWALFSEHLTLLKNNKTIQLPQYDFKTHTRKKNSLPFSPKKIILVDGMLILHKKSIRNLFDISIYMDTTQEERYKRRLNRDVEERGRTAEGVKEQFERQVAPMHDKYVGPSKIYADFVLDGNALSQERANFILGVIREKFLKT